MKPFRRHETLLPTLAEADAGFRDAAVLKDGGFLAKLYEQTGNPRVEMDSCDEVLIKVPEWGK